MIVDVNFLVGCVGSFWLFFMIFVGIVFFFMMLMLMMMFWDCDEVFYVCVVVEMI